MSLSTCLSLPVVARSKASELTLRYFKAAADVLHQHLARTVEVTLPGRDQLEDPGSEELLDGAVEPHGGELWVDVRAKFARGLGVGDDLRDRLKGAGDLRQVRPPE